MSSKATVGALRVMLGLDSAQFTQGLTKAQIEMKRFASMARGAALAVGTAMAAGAGVMSVAIKSVIDDADMMTKLAASIGIPIGELSKLRYAADLSGVSVESLGKAVKRLSTTMFEAGQSSTGAAAKSFEALGISIRDASGQIRPASAVIEDLSARFARMPNGVEKTALAMRIFGKSGADLIPLLNMGSDGLRSMYEEAEQLGIVLDEETGRAAEAFNDNLTRLNTTKTGIITKITAGMLPALESLTNALVDASKNTGALNAAGRFLGRTMQVQYTAIRFVGGAFLYLAQTIATASDVAGRMARFDFKGAVDALREGTLKSNASLLETGRAIALIWRPPSSEPSAAETLGEDLEGLGDSGGRAVRSIRRVSEAQRELNREAEEMQREGARIFEETRTPAEKYAATVEHLGRLLKVAAINQDTFNRRMAEAKATFENDDPGQQAARSIREKALQYQMEMAQARIDLAEETRASLEASTYDGIRGGLEAAADGNLGDYLAMKIRSALMDRLAGSLTDLMIGKGKGSGGGALGALSGAWGNAKAFGSLLSQMVRPSIGFATGGSFKVGGSPGKDKTPISFMATKGEMVDIRRPGQGFGGAQPVQVIVSTNDDRFNAYVDGRARPMAQDALSGARYAVPADMAKSSRYRRGR
jgi:hypothetical protein